MSNTYDTNTDACEYAYLRHGATRPGGAGVELAGLRKIQHFNESPYHRKTAIARGGYGINNEDGMHRRSARRSGGPSRGHFSTYGGHGGHIELGLIGFTGSYNLIEGGARNGRFHSAISHHC